MAKKNTSKQSPDNHLFSFSYDVNHTLLEDASLAMIGDRLRSPSNIASVLLLIVIVFIAMSPNGRQVTLLLTSLVCIEVVLWFVSDHWNQFHLWRLKKAGLDITGLPKESRRVKVDVFPDHLVANVPGKEGEELPLSTVRKLHLGREVSVVEFVGPRYVIVPKRALNEQRHRDLIQLVTPAK